MANIEPETETVLRKSEHINTLMLKSQETADDPDMTGDKSIDNGIEKMVFTTESFEMCSISSEKPLCTFK